MRITSITRALFSTLSIRPIMASTLVLGGYRDSIAVASFDPSKPNLTVTSDTPAPTRASWIQPAVNGSKVFWSISEADEGKAYGFQLEASGIKASLERDTKGSPAHIAALKDGSGIVVANYGGGSVIFLPIKSDSLAAQSDSPALVFPYLYENQTAPNPERQEASHPHQVVEGSNGTLYVPDLGNDRVWLVKRDGESGLKIDGYLQAPAGAGPRHVVESRDGKYLYCIAELGHDVIAWDLSTGSKDTIPGFGQSIIPPSIPATHSKYMDSSEIAINPRFPHTLYAANRLELQIFDKTPDLPPLPNYPPSGDAVAIVILTEDGSSVKDIKHVRTGANNLRGLTLSPDGTYVALAGQDGGGVEVYEIGGEHGEQWKLVSKAQLDNINTLAWA